MAQQRRMFSQQIVESDAFLDMPISSQALYFHLGMYADDDGFVNPKKIMRMLGTSTDDLKVLVGKRFVLTFENGVIVIKHWFVHNTLRKDRYKGTDYIDEKKLLTLKENGAYTEPGNQMATKWQPVVALNESKLKESKVKESKVKEIKIKETSEQSSQVVELINIFKALDPLINFGNKTLRNSALEVIQQYGFDAACRVAKFAVSIQGQPYAPSVVSPYQLKMKWVQLAGFYKRKQSKQIKIIG